MQETSTAWMEPHEDLVVLDSERFDGQATLVRKSARAGRGVIDLIAAGKCVCRLTVRYDKMNMDHRKTRHFASACDSHSSCVLSMKEYQFDSDRLDSEDLLCIAEAPQSEQGQAAADRLLKRHQQRVYVLCMRYLQDHEQALDLAQDVLLTVYQKLATYQHRSRFTSWLFIITRNRCLNELRKRTLRAFVDLDLDQLQTHDPNAVQRLAEQDLWNLVGTCLDQTEQDALHMRCIEGLAVDAITEILQIESTSGARGILQRARRKLRAALAKSDGKIGGASDES